MLKTGFLVGLVLLYTASYIHAESSYSCNPPETFEEKLDRIVEYADTDEDGMITAKDRDRAIILMDQNLDSFVSPYEFVMEWTCRYGDQADVAHRIFNQMTSGINLLTFELYRFSENQTVADFRASLYSFYTQAEINGS